MNKVAGRILLTTNWKGLFSNSQIPTSLIKTRFKKQDILVKFKLEHLHLHLYKMQDCLLILGEKKTSLIK